MPFYRGIFPGALKNIFRFRLKKKKKKKKKKSTHNQQLLNLLDIEKITVSKLAV